MSGILDKKERIMDFVITENGRSQIQDNDIRIRFASFSDTSINYIKDIKASFESKSDISGSEFYYLPLESSTKTLSNINPDFDLKKFFTYSYGQDQNGNVLDLNSLTNEQKQNLVTFNDYDKEFDKFYENFSFLANLKNLKLLSTERIINPDTSFRIESLNYNKEEYDFNRKVNKYITIRKSTATSMSLDTIALDRRFSHKNNFKVLIPKDISGIELYDKSSFKNIEKLTSKYNTSGLLLSNILRTKSQNEDISNREKEISKIIKEIEKNERVFRKDHVIVDNSERCSLIFEMNEISYNDDDDVSNRFLNIEKLHFIKIGDFYIENSLKKVYLIGKIINTRSDSTDLDTVFSFEEGTVNLKSNSVFLLPAFYSFITMFTLIVE